MCFLKRKVNPLQLLRKVTTLVATGVLSGALLTLSCASILLAAYSDPLDLPALKMEAAQNSLLLDLEYAGKRVITVGERGHILYSDDQGKNWQQADVDSMAHLTAVYFVNDKLGWAVGEDQVIIHTKDGGTSWTKIYDNRTSDVVAPLLDILFIDKQTGFAIGAYGTLLETTDGGQSWQDVGDRIDNIDEWHYNAITRTAGGSLYIAGEKGFVYRSDDDGQSWEVLRIPRVLTPEEIEDFVEPFYEISFLGVIPTKKEERLVFFGVGGRIFVTDDGGHSWRQVEVDTTAGLAGGALLDDGSMVIVGSDGVVLKGDAEAQNFSVHVRADRLPLTAVKPVGEKQYVTVGIAGILLSGMDELGDQPKKN
jgi:photosystem II stability/assembly factor-like uncharacterized protein